MSIGQRIKLFRQKAHISQEELAVKVGISRISMSNYERGERIPPVDVFLRIAQALHVSMDEVLEYDPKQDTFTKVLSLLKECGFLAVEHNIRKGLYAVYDTTDPFYVPVEKLKEDTDKTVLECGEDPSKIDAYYGMGRAYTVTKTDLIKIANSIKSAPEIKEGYHKAFIYAFNQNERKQIEEVQARIESDPKLQEQLRNQRKAIQELISRHISKK